MAASPLSDIEIHRELASMTGWMRRGTTIAKVFTFADFPAGIAWVRRVADEAETRDHHPDLDIRYTKITVTLSTHSAGGVTVKDFELARAIDGLGAPT